MQFVYPTFLWALVALAIPIIIHLFNFRRFKKVYFTNVKFLKEVKEETSSRRNLKHLLVLLSRLLALAALVLAFAQPFIPRNNAQVVQGNKAVSIYIDNSFSMNALSNDVSLFEKAKRKAIEIAKAYGPADRLQLITNDFEAKHQRLLDREEFLAYVQELDLSPKVQPMSEVVARQKQALQTAEDAAQKNLFLISDFQENIVDFSNDTTYNHYLIPLQALEQQNVYIDSVWFQSPVRMLNQANKLLVKLVNTGNTDVSDIRLTLRINEQTKALKDVNLAANETKTDTINFTITQAGWHNAEMLITDYPIIFDDSYYFTFKVDQKQQVLAINEANNNRFLQALFQNKSQFAYTSQSINQVNYEQLNKQQLIILDGLRSIPSGLAAALQVYLSQGGSLCIFPAKDIDQTNYNNFLRSLKSNSIQSTNTQNREVSRINTEQEIFSNVFERLDKNLDLPTANFSYNFTNYASSASQNLLQFRDGGAMVSRTTVGNGNLYLVATPLDTRLTNLPAHAIFVPMLYNMAIMGGKTGQLAYTIGLNELIEIDRPNKASTTDEVYKLKGSEAEFIPGQKNIGSTLLISPNQQLKTAGIYELYRQENTPLHYFGFNFDRKEGILKYLSLKDLKAKYSDSNIQFLDNANADFSRIVGEIDKGFVLWKWCLIAALAFLLIETLLLRFWRT